MFLHGDWIVGASFDPGVNSEIALDHTVTLAVRAIICHNHTLHTLYTPHTRNDAASRHVFPGIDLMPSKSRKL